MSETVKENIAKTVLLFIKNNLALLSAFIFLCFSLFDLYVFKETFHMNGAVFFNRVLPNAFGSFSQFWPYIFLPIITVIFVFGILYAWQFFSLDTVFKYLKSLTSDSKKLDTKYMFLIYFFSIFADILLLFILSKFNIQQPSLFFFLLYVSLIINNLFIMAIVSYHILIGKSGGLVIIYSLCYLFIKFLVSFIPFFYEFNFAGPLIVFNALAFIFFFLFRVLSFNDINIFKINTSKEVEKSFLDFIIKLIALVLIIPFGFGFFLYATSNLHTTPYRSKNFWSNFENKSTTLPLANLSILFNPAKIERMSEENKYNFDLVQQKRITEKYKNVFGEENNFFNQNLTHFSIPYGEKALIFLFDGEHVVSVYAHADELTNEVKKIYDVGYVEIKP